MKIIQVYECLCDETRLRILHLLSHTPLCVSHLQHVLGLPQVKVSKHLAYMKEREMVEATRLGNRVLYALPQQRCVELENNLKCLQDSIGDYPIFEQDLQSLKGVRDEVKELVDLLEMTNKGS